MVKRVVDVTETAFDRFLTKKIMVLCCRYIYVGQMVECNGEYITLKDAEIVFDTGATDAAKFTTASKDFSNETTLMKGAIESIRVYNK